MKYAVIKTGGKQYKVSEGMEIEVERLESEINKEYKFDQVLLYVNEDSYKVGQPNIDGAMVTAKVLEQKKGKKVRVAKFKAKSRYRKVQGHRQHLTKLQITVISIGNEKKASKPSGIAKDAKSVAQAAA